MNNLRNRIAITLINLVLKFIADDKYATWTAGAIQYGLLRLAEDAGETETYFKFWAPTAEEKYKMIQKFVAGDESVTIVNTSTDSIYFITSRKMQKRTLDRKGA